MKDQRKLQVFISSTYTDMQQERQAVVEAILKAGHIPAGMELFAANNETQWNTIKAWIDNSSVFLLILGGRYGTVDEKSGQSYIEMEFRYALESGKELFALILSDDYVQRKLKKTLRRLKTASDVSRHGEVHHVEKLAAFKKFVRSSRIAPECNSIDELKLYCTQSLNEIKEKEGIRAWIPDTPAAKRAVAISVLGKNHRGVEIIKALEESGLTDVENRDIAENYLPPTKLYGLVRHELLITGITLRYTFDVHQEHIEQLMATGKKLCFLMLDPYSQTAQSVSDAHSSRNVQILDEARGVISMITSKYANPNVALRFYANIPPYTGLLIDGNVDQTNGADDSHGILRVQPRTAFGIQHKGIVFQFKKVPGMHNSGFDFFAEDFRRQWANASKPSSQHSG